MISYSANSRQPSSILLTLSLLYYVVPFLCVLLFPGALTGEGPWQEAGRQVIWWPFYIPSIVIPYYRGRSGLCTVALALIPIAIIIAILPYSQALEEGMRTYGTLALSASVVLAFCVGFLAESSLTSRQATEEQNIQLKSLFEASELFAFSLDTQEVLEQCLSIIRKSLGFDFADIWLLDSNGEQLIKAASNIPMDDAKEMVPADCCLPGLALSTGEGVYIQDPLHDDRVEDKSWVLELGHSSEVALPLIYQGEKLGVMILASMQPYDFTAERRELMKTFVNQVSLAIKNTMLYREMEKKALVDHLTELYNRRFFQDTLDKEIKRAQRERESLSLLMLDLDCFKVYNDTYGHPEGDKLLREFSDVLQGAVRETDLVARYGGDEFAILLPNTDEEGARQSIKRIMEKIKQHKFPGFAHMQGGEISLSIGSATYPSTAGDRVELVKQADNDLYKIKDMRKKLYRHSS